MKIIEGEKTYHELLIVQWEGRDNNTHEKTVDIHRNDEGELLDVSLGSKEITGFELDILEFLKKEKKL